MYKFSFEEPKENETDEDIVMHNMKIADDIHNYEYFHMSQIGWFKLSQNKNANYYHLEIFLRENNFNTYLCARTPKTIHNNNLMYPNSEPGDEINKKIIYDCVYSCKPQKYALTEVLQNWKTYEENLDALKLAGFIKSELDDIGKLITENKLKIIAKYVSIHETLEELITDIKERHGKRPAHELVATLPDGSSVYALMVYKKIVCNIGYCVHNTTHNDKKYDENIEKSISLVNLNEILNKKN